MPVRVPAGTGHTWRCFGSAVASKARKCVSRLENCSRRSLATAAFVPRQRFGLLPVCVPAGARKIPATFLVGGGLLSLEMHYTLRELLLYIGRDNYLWRRHRTAMRGSARQAFGSITFVLGTRCAYGSWLNLSFRDATTAEGCTRERLNLRNPFFQRVQHPPPERIGQGIAPQALRPRPKPAHCRIGFVLVVSATSPPSIW